MTDEQRQRIHDIECSCDSRAELAERIVGLEDNNAKLKSNNNYLHEMLSESRQANEHLYTELKRHKSILRVRPKAMTVLYDENAKLRETVKAAWGCVNSPIGCRECRMVSGGCTLLSAMRELGIMVQS